MGRRGVLGPVPQTTVLQPFSNLPPNLIFFNCHSHNLVISTFSIVR